MAGRKRNEFNIQFRERDAILNPIFSTHQQTSARSQKRLISKNGAVNYRRLNFKLRCWYLKDIFTTLLDLSWASTLLLFVFCFVLSWLFFALIWYSLLIIHGDLPKVKHNDTNGYDPSCLLGVKSFAATLLFSIETQQTIGYGTRSINADCPVAIVILIIQSCFGLLIQALWVGLVYTRLSRPKNRSHTLIWSRQAVISLRDGFLTLQVRLGDMRHRSTLVEAHIRMYFLSERRTKENEIIPIHLFDMSVGYDTGKDRIFLDWPFIIEHRIDQQSPLYQMNQQQLCERNFEIFVILEGIIESTGMVTQAKTSYLPSEILWGHRFETMIHFDEHRHYRVDYSKFHQTIKDSLTRNCSARQLEGYNN